MLRNAPLKYFVSYLNIFSFIPMIKAVFSASLLQSSESHNPSEIPLIWWFAAQKHFWLLAMLKTVHIFVETVIHFYFDDTFMNIKFKRTAFSWYRIFL